MEGTRDRGRAHESTRRYESGPTGTRTPRRGRRRSGEVGLRMALECRSDRCCAEVSKGVDVT